ncbi:hypothetical protein XELAEV_18004246mg [Xenopus laevis]|uniref:Uncharacterized protein n=1 Tax=Xenopus laevis TaxID=8355 RepID=A0A974BNG1_XENLA|nr:hypothetical protein XELAEV_18004246mg [Xenopus laevis]
MELQSTSELTNSCEKCANCYVHMCLCIVHLVTDHLCKYRQYSGRMGAAEEGNGETMIQMQMGKPKHHIPSSFLSMEL